MVIGTFYSNVAPLAQTPTKRATSDASGTFVSGSARQAASICVQFSGYVADCWSLKATKPECQTNFYVMARMAQHFSLFFDNKKRL